MGESIAVIIVVIILLVIGITFWRVLHMEDIKDTADLSSEYSVIELSKTVMELPELKCYAAQSVSKVNCFDYYKIKAMEEKIIDPNDRSAFNYYSNYFKHSTITFSILYPDLDGNVNSEIILYDNAIPDAVKTLDIVIPIIIEKKLDKAGIKYFGTITVEGYYK
jgi:hypothetical protein